MEKSGFDYAGNAGLHHNLSTLTPGSDAQAPGEGLPVALQQMLFDVRWNVAQRRDIYVRHTDGAPGVSESLPKELPIYVNREALETKSRRELKKHFPGFDFCAAGADEFARIAGGAATFGDLFEQLNTSGISNEEGMTIARHFLAARLISIAASSTRDVGEESAFQMGSVLNQNILIDDIGAEYARPFASPVAGSRVLLPLKDRLYLWRLVGLDLGDAWHHLDHMKDAFRGADNEVLSREGFIQTIETSLPAFRQHAVPELLRLGILRPAPRAG